MKTTQLFLATLALCVWHCSVGYAQQAEFPATNRTLRVADITQDATGDGLADIVIGDSFNVFVFPSAEDGCPPNYRLHFPYGCVLDWGLPGDFIAHFGGDYDSDGLRDTIKVRANPHPVLYLLPSSGCPAYTQPHYHGCERPWGLAGDIVVGGSNFDSHPAADPAVFRPHEGRWYALMSGGACPAGWTQHIDGCSVQWGLPGDLPLSQFDIDQDGRSDPTVRRSNNRFYSRPSSGGCPATWQPHGPGCEITWGSTSDTVLVGDFNGDGWTQIAAMNNTTVSPIGLSSFQLARALGNVSRYANIMITGDFDGDSRTDVGAIVANPAGRQIIFDPTSNSCPAAYSLKQPSGGPSQRYCELVVTF